MRAIVRRRLRQMAVTAFLIGDLLLLHQTHTYGMPWNGPVLESVGCVQPAADGPVRWWDGSAWQAGWPRVCHEWSDGRPRNGGVFVDLFGRQVGVEVYGTPGLFVSADR